MCSVDKLLIKGIRSFSPENDHAIVFPKPLTLIVGRNGAGKTVRRAPPRLGLEFRIWAPHANAPSRRRPARPPSRPPSPLSRASLVRPSPDAESAHPARSAPPRAARQTVIECLKMATTGELPPSARAGQAFIHDPKVADVTEVKAQIKLRFRDVRKQPCVVTRSFQLTQVSSSSVHWSPYDRVHVVNVSRGGAWRAVPRSFISSSIRSDADGPPTDRRARPLLSLSLSLRRRVASISRDQKSGGKLEKKDLDQVIQTLDEKTGEKVSVSRKCADINATVPDMMGVSKAILENVVFVHQEDSNWPLGEAATLKKKFDEIFSATKYTKALEHINKLRKEQSATIKEYKLKVETLRVQCDHATKLKQRLDENAGKATRLGERMRTLQEKIDRANEALKARHDDLSAIRKIAEKKALLEAKRDVVVAECARRGASLKNELTDTLENLQSHRDAFGAKTAELRAELERHDAKCASLAACARELREKRERDLRAHGKLTAEAEAHGKRLSARASQARSARTFFTSRFARFQRSIDRSVSTLDRSLGFNARSIARVPPFRLTDTRVSCA
jgi:DNA repair exonuclease SbcCD ATPase subunit